MKPTLILSLIFIVLLINVKAQQKDSIRFCDSKKNYGWYKGKI